MAKVKTKQDRVIAYLQYLIYRAFEFFLKLFPVSWVFVMGQGLGGLAYGLFNKKRALVLENLKKSFPSLANQESVKRLFKNIAGNLLTSVRFGSIPGEQLSQYATWVENDAYKEVVAAEHPRLVLLGHVSNWELLARMLPQLTPLAGALYRTLDNPYLDTLVKRRREKDGMQLFSNRKGLIQAMRILKNKGLLGLLIDQYKAKANITTAPFGHPTKVSRMPNMILEKLNDSKSDTPVKVYYLSLKMITPGKWHLEFKTKADASTLDVGDAIEWCYNYSPLEVFFLHRLWR